MKILHLSKSDSSGGAGIAALRLHKALRQNKIDSRLLCLDKKRNDWDIIGPETSFSKASAVFRGFIDRSPIYLYPKRSTAMFYPQWLPNNIHAQILKENPDILHLHWICGGFIRLESLSRFKIPIVWTMHDMWPFTGGCHYSFDCTGYKKKCGICPQLGSSHERDLSRWIWNRKKKLFDRLTLELVSPSKWLSDCAVSSSLYKKKTIHIVSNTINLNCFSPKNRECARNILNLPSSKKIILFGADNFISDNRKAFHTLQPLLKYLKNLFSPQDLSIAIFGSSEPNRKIGYPFNIKYFGTLNDEISISLLYAACDAYITASMQDNQPLTVMEALSCGTPVISYDIGGIPDMVIHKKNGYLARPCDLKDMASGIKWVLEDRHQWELLSLQARKTSEASFSTQTVIDKYMNIYESVLNK